MYEQFTADARRVMQLANQEAMRLNHEYIGTEHVLLGLVEAGPGVAANVLDNFRVDRRRVRRELEGIIQGGPDAATLGKLPQTPRAKKVIEYALEEARRFQHCYVGTEHLLLGLLREEEGVAAQVLMNLGIRLDTARAEVARVLGQDLPTGEPVPEVAPIVSGEFETIPAGLREHPLVRQLMRTIEEFSLQKEWCVAKQQFEEAALLRDQCDRTRKDLHQVIDLLRRNPDLGMTQNDNPADS